MATSIVFRIQRLTLAAATLTPIAPLMDAREVSIGNGTGALLEVHTNSDGTEYLTIAAGVEKPFASSMLLYRRDHVAFWLKSTPGGLVILTWKQ